MSSTSSPCAACKFLRRKCTQECVFAPYFPPDHPQKFANVHKVFGASNITKLLNELDASQREDAVNSLAFEADYRLRDPVYGCVGMISVLQHKLAQIKYDIMMAKKELAKYIGPSAMLPILQHPNHPSSSAAAAGMAFNNMQPMMGGMGMGMGIGMGMGTEMGMGMVSPTGVPQGGQLVIRDQQQQQHHRQHPQQHHRQHPQQNHHHQQHQLMVEAQHLEAQQLAAVYAAREQEEMLRSYELQRHHQQQQQQRQQQHESVGFDSGFDAAGPVTATGFNQMNAPAADTGEMLPSLALGTYDYPYQVQEQQQQLHGQDLSRHHHQQKQQQQLHGEDISRHHHHHQQLNGQDTSRHHHQQQHHGEDLSLHHHVHHQLHPQQQRQHQHQQQEHQLLQIEQPQRSSHEHNHHHHLLQEQQNSQHELHLFQQLHEPHEHHLLQQQQQPQRSHHHQKHQQHGDKSEEDTSLVPSCENI